MTLKMVTPNEKISTADSLSIIVPAFNEEFNLELTIEGLIPVISKEFSDFEIIIFNDGSADKTGAIADKLQTRYPKIIRVIHNPVNRGLGYNYVSGLKLATKKYVTMCPADNENTPESIIEICKHRNKAQIIIPFPVNMAVRSWQRRAISRTYVMLLNTLARQNIKYYNGTVLHTTDLVSKLKVESEGFGYQAEILVKLLKQGSTYEQVPFQLGESGRKKSAAFRPKNIISVIKTIANIAFETK